MGSLDGVDQGLAQTQQFSLFRIVAHIDPGGVLDPDNGQTVSGAESDEFIHLHQTLTVQLAADTHRAGSLVFRVVHQQALDVGHNAHQQAVDFGQAGNHFRTVAFLVFPHFAVVEQTADNIVDVISPFVVQGNHGVQIVSRECRCFRIVHPEEFRIVFGQHAYILLDPFQNAFFGSIDFPDETGFGVVDVDSSRRFGLAGTVHHVSDFVGIFQVHMAFGVHAAHNAGAAYSHVGFFMGNDHRGADGMIAAAGRVGAVDAHDDGNAQLVQFSVPEEGSTAATTVGVYLFLFVELNAGAVQHIHQRHVQGLGSVGSPQQAFSLARDPGAGQLLVVGSHHYAPFAVYTAQALDDGHGAVLVALRIEQGVQGSPGARFHQFFNSLESGQFPSLVYISICLAGFLSGFDQLMDLFFDLFQLFFISGIHLFQGFAHLRHLLEISRHRVKTHLTSSSRMSYFASGAGTLMKAWPGSISSRISLITAGSGASSSTALDTSRSNPVFSRTSSGEEVG